METTITQNDLSTCKPENQHLCRLCTKMCVSTVEIFGEHSLTNRISEKINKYLPTKVSPEDDLPLSCCWDCYRTVMSWHEFVEACANSEKKLRLIKMNNEDKELTMADINEMDLNVVKSEMKGEEIILDEEVILKQEFVSDDEDEWSLDEEVEDLEADERKQFGSISETEINAEFADKISRNTKKCQNFIWRQFTTFLEENDYIIDGSPENLNLILKSWAYNMKRKDGSNYTAAVVKLMWNITAKLVQVLVWEKWKVRINPFRDSTFNPARDARDATRIKLLACKRPISAAPFTEREYHDIVHTLDEKVPDGLQQKFFVIAARELSWKSNEGYNCLTYFFKPELDKEGFLTGRIEYNPKFSKTAQEDAKPLNTSKWLVENKNNPDMCPVRLYYLLMSKRGQNIKTERMFLLPSPSAGLWYKSIPVAINKMRKWIKTLAEKSGINVKNRKISINSLHKTKGPRAKASKLIRRPKMFS